MNIEINEKIARYCNMLRYEDPKHINDIIWENPFDRNNTLPSEDLCFDSDWNWLMYAVKKIEKYNRKNNGPDFIINGNRVILGKKEFVRINKFDAILQAVVTFIDDLR